MHGKEFEEFKGGKLSNKNYNKVEYCIQQFTFNANFPGKLKKYLNIIFLTKC